ncbi:AraC family ligand binding domain-containing protein [Sporosarcina aquimarina]|uniref:AraC family ligand binding domain-containing protein n=1 Tax=Sporosarcina aquimarina TaxID=114975 RepID=UPI0020426002|nr:AraC family ligand binding domain-containing protein [Sporosarcina aquimarina]MCM3757668.1 AraC family ligand binding domain-containing protein [Sporosarcina aquimarina]
MKLIETPRQLDSKAKSVEQVCAIPNANVLNIQLRAGEEVSEHDTDREVLIIVRKGRIRFMVEGTPTTVTGETILHMVPNEKHSLIAETDSDICVLQITP